MMPVPFDSKPMISVVIAAKNAEATIEKCIKSVLNISYPNREMIIVDDGSVDGTNRILAGFPEVIILRTPGVGPAQARNMGVRISKGEFLAFLDSDCVAAPEWLDELMKGFQCDDVAGVGGHQESPADECEFGKKVHRFFVKAGFLTGYMHHSRHLEEVPHNASCNVMYRRNIFLEVDGFDERFSAGEDPDLDRRICQKGYRLMKNPGAVVFHYRVKNLSAFRRVMFSYGRAQGQLVRRYGIFRKIQWVPVACLAGLSALAIGLCFAPFKATLVAAILFLLFGFSMSFDPRLVLLSGVALYAWNLGFVRGFIGKGN